MGRTAATPPAIVQKLAEAQTAFDNISARLRVTTPQEVPALIKAENKRWGDLIRKLGIKAD